MKSIFRRYRKIKIFLTIVFFGLYAAYFMVKQPVCFNYQFPTNTLFSELRFADARKLESHVKYLSKNDRTSVEGLNKIIAYLENELNISGISNNEIEKQVYTVGKRTFQNIIVHLRAPIRKEEPISRYIIGAHYDSYSNLRCFSSAFCDFSSDLLPGADDNASGVAGLLEIARILKHSTNLNRDIDLVFYSTEEPPFYGTDSMGSYHHAKQTKNVDLVIVLEMIGYFSEQSHSQYFPVSFMKYFYPTTGNFIAIVSNFDNAIPTRQVKRRFASFLAKDNNIGVESINAPKRVTGIDFSDHRNYWHFDIPALMITDTSFYRNRNYHTVEDTYEKLDYHKMKSVVDATVATVLSL